VLATALPGTELCRVVVQDAACGLVVPPENPAALADALRALAADPVRRAEWGANGRRYAEAELSQDVVLRRFETQLLALGQKGETLCATSSS
jgi:colanic acid biosynthesis glycosyl transferase WcaI